MTVREIADLFADLELRLIQSLKRNLTAHKSQEKAEGGQNGVPESWPAWQAEKLRSLNRFRQQNQKIGEEFSSKIDAETRTLLEQQFAEADGSEQAFFGVNGEKVGALIDEMTATEADVQKAALRYMDDVYRRTILRADAAFTTGGVTMQQAVDLAVKDFLEQGITCIRYKNGRRVNIATYAEMALRTSNTRAMLLGEAQKRERMGIDTVLVSQYGACSQTCLPWQGLVYIDDVWQPYHGSSNAAAGGSYGVSRNGRSYLLLSVAVKAGLFHPNCRHTVGTWIEGVSRRPKPMDKAKIEATSRLEARQRRMELQIRKDKRLVAGTQAPDRVKEYKAELRRDQKALREFVAEHGDVLRGDRWRERNDLPGGETAYQAEKKKDQFAKFREENLATSEKELLPNREKAEIPDKKLLDYMLNPDHPKGGSKAVVFRNVLGYTKENAQDLASAFRKGLNSWKATERKPQKHGRPYEVKMLLSGPTGRQATVKTGWIMDDGSDHPRLTSAYIYKEK